MAPKDDILLTFGKFSKFFGLPTIYHGRQSKKYFRGNCKPFYTIFMLLKIVWLGFVLIHITNYMENNIFTSGSKEVLNIVLFIMTDVAWFFPTMAIEIICFLSSNRFQELISDLIDLKQALRTNSTMYSDQSFKFAKFVKRLLTFIITYAVFFIIFDFTCNKLLGRELKLNIILYQNYFTLSGVTFSLIFLQQFIVLSDIKMLYKSCSDQLVGVEKIKLIKVFDVFLKTSNISSRFENMLSPINLCLAALVFSQLTLFVFKFLFLTVSKREVDSAIYLISHAFWMAPNILPIILFYQCDSAYQEVSKMKVFLFFYDLRNLKLFKIRLHKI